MRFSRRTFLASSLAAGAVAAAESPESQWFLAKGKPVHIGLVDCGADADYVALIAAIPRTKIVGLVNMHGTVAQEYMMLLSEWGRPGPKVYDNLVRMLQDSSLDVVFLAGKRLLGPSILKRVTEAGFPVLADWPPEVTHSEQQIVLDVLRLAETPVHFRTDQLAEGAGIKEIRNWLVRSGAARIQVTLVSPIGVGREHLHTAGTLSLSAVLGVCGQPATALQSWLGSTLRPINSGGGRKLAKISVPDNPYGIEHLYLRPYGGHSKLARLLLEHRGGSLEIPISDVANPQDSLRTTIRFLSRVTSQLPVDNSDSLHLQLASIRMQSVQTN